VRRGGGAGHGRGGRRSPRRRGNVDAVKMVQAAVFLDDGGLRWMGATGGGSYNLRMKGEVNEAEQSMRNRAGRWSLP
jgi:hypothetical protein